jgi:hypothetical protein
MTGKRIGSERRPWPDDRRIGSPVASDPVRNMIAGMIRRALVTTPKRPPEAAWPDTVLSVEGKAVNQNVTAIKVTARDSIGGTVTRVFLVKLNEARDHEW